MMRLQFFRDLFFVCSSGLKRSRNDLGVSCRVHACVANLQQFVQHRLQKTTLGSCRDGKDHEIFHDPSHGPAYACTSSSADLQQLLQIRINYYIYFPHTFYIQNAFSLNFWTQVSRRNEFILDCAS